MTCPFLKAVLLTLAILATPSSAREFTTEEYLLCSAKQTVVEYVYTHRNVKSKKHMFEALDITWEERWTSLPYATYVDLRRIINEAYRPAKDGYRREACIAGDTTENSEDCKALVLDRVVDECRAALHYGF